jgi:hypothetical protein
VPPLIGFSAPAFDFVPTVERRRKKQMVSFDLPAFEKLKHRFESAWNLIAPKLHEPEIARHFVASQCIATLGHDASHDCLQVEYLNGILYRFDNVPEPKYRILMEAEKFDHAFKEMIVSHHQATRIGCIAPVYR